MQADHFAKAMEDVTTKISQEVVMEVRDGGQRCAFSAVVRGVATAALHTELRRELLDRLRATEGLERQLMESRPFKLLLSDRHDEHAVATKYVASVLKPEQSEDDE